MTSFCTFLVARTDYRQHKFGATCCQMLITAQGIPWKEAAFPAEGTSKLTPIQGGHKLWRENQPAWVAGGARLARYAKLFQPGRR